MHKVLLGFLILFSLPSWAALSEISISSYASPTGDNVSAMQIFVGSAGDTAACPAEYTDTPCNTCTSVTNLCADTKTSCNEKAVLPTTMLMVSFKTNSTSAINSSNAKISIGSTTAVAANAYSQTDFSAASATNNFANQTLSAAFRWEDICQAAAGDPTCTSNISAKSLKVGISDGTTIGSESFTLEVNFRYVGNLISQYHNDCGSGGVPPDQYNGACGVSLLPGDGKVYVSEVQLPLTVEGSDVNSWPSTGADVAKITYTGIRLFYTETTNYDANRVPATSEWCNISLNSEGTFRADVSISSDGLIANRKVTGGLENDKTYVFIMASVDKAGNVTDFSNPSNVSPWANNTYGIHYATPGEVVGLLDGKKCFIATAAYGSEMAPQVELLRKFRNQFLLSSDWGRKFVKLYYKLSPRMAEFIAESYWLKSATRILLWPLILFADVAIRFGIIFTTGILIIFGFVILSFVYFRFWKKEPLQ